MREIRCEKCQNWINSEETCPNCGQEVYRAVPVQKLTRKDFRFKANIKKSVPFQGIENNPFLLRFLKNIVNVAFLIYFAILSAVLWMFFWLPG